MLDFNGFSQSDYEYYRKVLGVNWIKKSSGNRKQLACGCRYTHRVNTYGTPYWHRRRNCKRKIGCLHNRLG